MDEKVRQGWPTGLAPFGYLNVADRDEPVQPHPEKSRTLIRIFELYASGSYTFKSLADRLESEGNVFRPSRLRFNRTALSHILINRFDIGELQRNGKVFEGRYRRVIDQATFDACQDILTVEIGEPGDRNTLWPMVSSVVSIAVNRSPGSASVGS